MAVVVARALMQKVFVGSQVVRSVEPARTTDCVDECSSVRADATALLDGERGEAVVRICSEHEVAMLADLLGRHLSDLRSRTVPKDTPNTATTVVLHYRVIFSPQRPARL